jgi:hypothetical protein
MSTLKLKSKEDIKRFFKILAEESVKDAKEQFRLDPKTRSLMQQVERDALAYSELKSELREEEEPEAAPAEEVEAEEVEIETEPQQASPEAIDIEQVSLDSIRDKIKTMRSGLSVDDSSVQGPMRSYFDLLNDPERRALYAFIDALAGIMTGQSSAESAPDPSDPPYNVQMTAGEEESVSEEPAEEIADQESSDAEVEASEDQPEEDAEIPIQVGKVQESASIEKIRNRVRELLSKK